MINTPPCTLEIRRLERVDDAQLEQLADILVDCVEGGASVSFMLPMTRAKALAFWRKVADDVALGGSHQRLAQPLAARTAVHQHLGDVGAVRLVLGLVEDHLHGAHDAVGVLGHQQHALAARHAVAHLAPERERLVVRHRQHEAHRRPAFDAVDEHVGQAPQLRLVQGVEPADFKGRGWGVVRHGISARAGGGAWRPAPRRSARRPCAGCGR